MSRQNPSSEIDNKVAQDVEELRSKFRAEVYGMASSALPALILDLDEIENADEEGLKEIAKRFGY